MIQAMPHDAVGTLRVLRNPIKLDGQRLDGTPGHGLGADNEAIFGTELGLSETDLDALRSSGAI